MASGGVQLTGVGVSLVASNPACLDGTWALVDLPPASDNPATMAWVGTPGNMVLYYSDGTNWKTLQGPAGGTGAAATISVGSTSTLGAGASATVANSGSPAAAIFDFGIPTGAAGAAGVNAFGAPVARTLVFATAYQASTPAKPSLLTAFIDLSVSISIGAASNTVELITGPTSAVSSGTGVLTDSWRNDLSVTLISISITSRQKITAALPANYFFAIRRTVGTGMTISSAFDQAVG